MINSTLSRVLLIFSFCIVMSSARAQYIAIPDSNFGNWIRHNGGDSVCLTGNGTVGWQLDTTCSVILNTTTLSISGRTIRDLTGIQYFKSLRYLSCSGSVFNGDSLSNIPALPSTLTSLNCSYSILHGLPALPAGLDTLICNHSNITSLPALPSSLMY